MTDPTTGCLSINSDWLDRNHLGRAMFRVAFAKGENRLLSGPLPLLLLMAGGIVPETSPFGELPKHTYKVTGLAWPESMGEFALMGPSNRLGAWRWYQRSFVVEGIKITERIKLDNHLQPVWNSLVITRA